MIEKEDRDLAKELPAIVARIDAMDKAVEVLSRYPTEVDKAVGNLRELLGQRFEAVEGQVSRSLELLPKFHESISRIDVIFARLDGLEKEIDRRMSAQREAAALALVAVEKATVISQTTADRAMARAEAAADRVLMESMIGAVRDNFAGHIQAVKDSLYAAMAAAKEAVTKSEAAMEKRFEGVNEFRAQLSDQAQRFMPRQEAEAWSRSNADKIDTLASRLDRIEGRTSGFASSGTVLSAVVAIVATVISATIAILAFNS